MMEKTSIKKCGGVDVGVCLNVDYTIFSLSIYNLQPIFTTKSTSTKSNDNLQSTTNNVQIYTLFFVNKTH